MGEVAGVGFLEQANARVLAQAKIHLAIAGVDRDHARSAALQKAIGEASGRGAHVEAHQVIHVDAPVIERTLELESAAAYVLQIVAQQTQRGVALNGGSGLFDLLLVHQNFSGKNQRLRAFARRHQAAFHEQFVEAQFHRSAIRTLCMRVRSSSTTKVPALVPVQGVELILSESLRWRLSTLSTEFSTGVLKTTGTLIAQYGNKKAACIRRH